MTPKYLDRYWDRRRVRAMWIKQVFPSIRPAITDSKGNGYLFNPTSLQIIIPGKVQASR